MSESFATNYAKAIDDLAGKIFIFFVFIAGI